jgi:hypothetical protein
VKKNMKKFLLSVLAAGMLTFSAGSAVFADDSEEVVVDEQVVEAQAYSDPVGGGVRP